MRWFRRATRFCSAGSKCRPCTLVPCERGACIHRLLSIRFTFGKRGKVIYTLFGHHWRRRSCDFFPRLVVRSSFCSVCIHEEALMDNLVLILFFKTFFALGALVMHPGLSITVTIRVYRNLTLSRALDARSLRFFFFSCLIWSKETNLSSLYNSKNNRVCHPAMQNRRIIV